MRNSRTWPGLRAYPVLFLSFGGCQLSVEEPVDMGSSHVMSALVSASTGGTLEITAELSAALAGTKIEIPPGSLAEDTRITIDPGPATLAGADSTGSGPSVKFGPDGTRFSKKAKIRIPLTGAFDEDLARVYVLNADGSRQVLMPAALSFDSATQTVGFEVEHFTAFQNGRAGHACQDNESCPGASGCHRGECPSEPDPDPDPDPNECAESDCGPALGLPNWVCEDGSAGGPTGRCLRQSDGSCGWEVVWCPHACTELDCGPVPRIDPSQVCGDVLCRRGDNDQCAWQVPECPEPHDCTEAECGVGPGAPNYVCADGTVAGPTCERDAAGHCGWHMIECPCAPTVPPCAADFECAAGELCVESYCRPVRSECATDTDCIGGRCVNGVCDSGNGLLPPPACTDNSACPPGQFCNQGACEPGEACSAGTECGTGSICHQGLCVPSNDPTTCSDPCAGVTCSNGARCDPTTGRCDIGELACGNTTCGAGEYCCNPSCGLCAPEGGVCTQQVCDTCTDRTCPVGSVCNAGHCEAAECGANDCGPALGLANWACENGEVGGPTGRCLRNAGGGCGWEINYCTPVCAATDCGEPPAGARITSDGHAVLACPNGATVELSCQRDNTVNGACAWSSGHCPI
ncbi:MAG: hypothetical protein HYV07_28200 [Deltaproteobacteria bacterium]|nr:hypothetical protein [Deltaproteobacteria bacterium]